MLSQDSYNPSHFRHLTQLTPVALVSTVTILHSVPAQALTFNFSYGTETPQAVIDNMTLAGDLWSSQLSDDVALNIHIDFGALPDGILGGARPNMVRVKYGDVLAGMFLDQTSLDDQIAFDNLQIDQKSQQAIADYRSGSLDISKLKISKDNAFSLLMSQPTPGNNTNNNTNGNSQARTRNVYLDDNGNENNQHIWMTRANAKALGLIDQHSQEFDATLRFNDSILWDFEHGDGISAKALDFLTVAQHEIGHALGVVSGSDVAGLLYKNNSESLSEKDLHYVGTMDLFRFSTESANVIWETKDREIAQGVTDWTLGRIDENGNPIDYYFSIDGGQGKIASLARGILGKGADGFQTSHWAVTGESPLGIMNPYLRLGQSIAISDLDTQLLDVLGWDLRSVTGDESSLNSAAFFTKEGLEEAFWLSALDQIALQEWLTKTEQHLLSYTTNKQLKIASEQQFLEEQQFELTQTLQTLEALEDRQKEMKNKAGERQTKAQIKAIEDELEKLEEQDKVLNDQTEELMKWQADLLKELNEQWHKFEAATEEDRIDGFSEALSEREKRLQKLAEQDGSDKFLTWGGWSNTDYSYRFWQSLDVEDEDDDFFEEHIFQMSVADTPMSSVPEPTTTGGFVAIALWGMRKLRKR